MSIEQKNEMLIRAVIILRHQAHLRPTFTFLNLELGGSNLTNGNLWHFRGIEIFLILTPLSKGLLS